MTQPFRYSADDFKQALGSLIPTGRVWMLDGGTTNEVITVEQQTQVVVEGDPYWDNVVMLLRMDGTGGAEPIDDKGYPIVLGDNDGVSDPSHYPGVPTTSAAGTHFPGGFIGGNLVSPVYWVASYRDGFLFGTAPMTFEFWITPAAAQYQIGNLIFNGGHSYAFSISLAGVAPPYSIFVDFGVGLYLSGGALEAGTEYHVESDRSGGDLFLFINGQQVATMHSSDPEFGIFCNDKLIVGGQTGSYAMARCTMRYVRVTNGVARHVANFTPPSLPLLEGPTTETVTVDVQEIVQLAGNPLALTLAGLAVEPSRTCDRAFNLLVDAFPATAVELLPEWEESLGLPNPCTGPLATVELRQAAVVAALAGAGSPTRGVFTAIAVAMGYTTTIHEHAPFRAGRSLCGQVLGPPECIFAWEISGTEAAVQQFVCGVNRCGDPLAYLASVPLQCAFAPLVPSHTQLTLLP
jgi:uncharacterized protein YmfQ (DUF2313 family)